MTQRINTGTISTLPDEARLIDEALRGRPARRDADWVRFLEEEGRVA